MSDLSIAVFLLAENCPLREAPTRFPNRKTTKNDSTAVDSAEYSLAVPEAVAAACATVAQRSQAKQKSRID
jgi:hypothetical protein